ncbi:MAG: hypothetical protein K6E75_11965 [Lachnospiraceae bacterium]|nr:hypothetical protein [Lachnospiraceae bacterium]
MADKTKAEMQEEIRKRKQAERERARRIKKANKMLIVMPKKTQRSLGLIQYDPSGVFHFLDGRWMKVFKVANGIENLPGTLFMLKARAMLFHHIEGDEDTYYLSLFREGDIYEPVRKAFLADEEVLRKSLWIRSLSAEETAEEIRKQTGLMDKPWEFSEFMKKRRDLLSETVPKITSDYAALFMKDTAAGSYFILQYPNGEMKSMIRLLRGIADHIFITTEVCSVSQETRQEQIQYLKSRYTGLTEERSIQPYANVQIRIMLLCHEKDSLAVAKTKLEEACFAAGYVISPIFGQQKESAESILTLGMVQQGSLHNIQEGAIREIFAKEHEHDPDKV